MTAEQVEHYLNSLPNQLLFEMRRAETDNAYMALQELEQESVERLDPPALFAFLEDELQEQGDAIFKHDGVEVLLDETDPDQALDLMWGMDPPREEGNDLVSVVEAQNPQFQANTAPLLYHVCDPIVEDVSARLEPEVNRRRMEALDAAFAIGAP